MREHPCTFGPQLNLIGMFTEPVSVAARLEAPVVLVLNAGLLHRVGPNRMAVLLARRLAALGISSLRFDLSGRGDSEASGRAGSDEERVLADVGDAMDYIERRCNAHRFVLFGLCAGADNAYEVALRDSRVVGAILLDGHGYRTRGYYLAHYGPRLLRPARWVSFARRVLKRRRPAPVMLGEHGQRRPFRPRLEVEREIQSLVDRGVQLLYLYTAGVNYYYNYRRQFEDMFAGLDARGRIAVEHFPNADHTYTFGEDREHMLTRAVEWYGSRSWSSN